LKRKFSKKPLYVDSNIFIYPAIYDPLSIPEAATATARLREIASGAIEACTSTLTWDEVTWVVRRLFDPGRAAAQGASFLRLPNLKLLKVDGETISEAQSIVESHDLKPRDAIHAATALTNGIHRILSFDHDFDAIPSLTRITP
jgi:predicted nucleic acid-binding protein